MRQREDSVKNPYMQDFSYPGFVLSTNLVNNKLFIDSNDIEIKSRGADYPRNVDSWFVGFFDQSIVSQADMCNPLCCLLIILLVSIAAYQNGVVPLLIQASPQLPLIALRNRSGGLS